MYPSWGNYGAPQSQNYGGSGPRKPPGGGGLAGQAPGFGGFEASSGGSMFSSLQEQHLQQMQQLQMLHQKQLQNVLHHGNNANAFGGYSGWHSEGAGHADNGAGAPPYYQQDEAAAAAAQPARGPPAPQPGHSQPPPPPPQPQPSDTQPLPPPPEPPAAKPPENNGAPKATEASKTDAPPAEDDKSLPLQVESCCCLC